MELSKLHIAEMLALSEEWITTTKMMLEAIPEVRDLVPPLTRVHEHLSAVQEAHQREVLADLELAIEEADRSHDAALHCLILGLEGLKLWWTVDQPAPKWSVARLRTLQLRLLPKGAAMARLPYVEQVNHAKAVVAGFSEEESSQLGELLIYDSNLWHVIDRWHVAAMELSDLLTSHADRLQELRELPGDMKARQTWGRVVSAFYERLNHSPTPQGLKRRLLEPLHDAWERHEAFHMEQAPAGG